MRLQLIVEFINLTKTQLPSYHILTKSHLTITPIEITPDTHNSLFDHDSSAGMDSSIVSTPMMSKDKMLIPLLKSSQLYLVDVDMEGEMAKLQASENILGGRIEGTYETYVSIMADKHFSCGRKLEGELIVMDSYDGADHGHTVLKNNGIVSYSSQMFSLSTIQSGSSPAGNFNILTWQQMLGKETPSQYFHLSIIFLTVRRN